eukprot:1178418-Prorocentrum_minimum.AAC.6
MATNTPTIDTGASFAAVVAIAGASVLLHALLGRRSLASSVANLAVPGAVGGGDSGWGHEKLSYVRPAVVRGRRPYGHLKHLGDALLQLVAAGDGCGEWLSEAFEKRRRWRQRR